MGAAVGTPIIIFLYVLLACVFLRALMSWFPVSPRNEFVRALDRVTRPILDPVRRVVPAIGFIDISAFLVIVALLLMIEVVQQATG